MFPHNTALTHRARWTHNQFINRPLTSCSECWSTETKRFDVGPIVRNNTDNQHSNLQVSHYHEANAKRCREKSHYLFSMLTSPLKDTGSATNTKMPNRKHKRSPQNNLCSAHRRSAVRERRTGSGRVRQTHAVSCGEGSLTAGQMKRKEKESRAHQLHGRHFNSF